MSDEGNNDDDDVPMVKMMMSPIVRPCRSGMVQDDCGDMKDPLFDGECRRCFQYGRQFGRFLTQGLMGDLSKEIGLR